jgi:hypothetical protein
MGVEWTVEMFTAHVIEIEEELQGEYLLNIERGCTFRFVLGSTKKLDFVLRRWSCSVPAPPSLRCIGTCGPRASS